jgi:hypothetical protein
MFVIDRSGNLDNTTAAGKLKMVLDEMLRKEKGKASKLPCMVRRQSLNTC